jgi:Uma2 family endonuclease
MAEIGTLTQIGPESHGRRMSLEEFARVAGRPGYLYELSRGVIEVVDVPGVPHRLVKLRIRNALVLCQVQHPDRIFAIADGSDMAIRMPQLVSERHPDICVYLTPPPVEDVQPWDFWVPDIVIEVVSPGSEQRDYEEKREDYLKAGVRLYWIFDPQSRSATLLTRRGDDWRAQKLDESGTVKTRLLPGFELKLADVFGVLG